MNLGSPATLVFSAENPNSDITTATWKFTDASGSQTCTSGSCTITTVAGTTMTGEAPSYEYIYQLLRIK